MEKILMLASVASMIDQFNMPNIKTLLEMGYDVHVAANFEKGNTSSKQRIIVFEKELNELGVLWHQIDFSRNIFKISENIKAYKQVECLIGNNNFAFIHCHSPIGGLCGRIAAYTTKTPIIYTAHGFHFFKGAPLINWLLYYPIEKWMSRYTDVLITINNEDFRRALNSFKAKNTKYIPGVGIDTKLLSKPLIEKEEKRKELGIPLSSFVILSIGELNENKNHETIIKAVAKLNNKNIVYIICGIGQKEKYLKELAASLNIEDCVRLLGFRNDISEICNAADIFAFPSHREGLGLAALEAMATGLPLVTSNIHGILDYSMNGITGFNSDSKDVESFALNIRRLIDDDKLRSEMQFNNKETAKNYDVEKVQEIMKGIYRSFV